MKHYKVTYTRLPKNQSKVKAAVYSEGHYRTITMMAESEEAAKKIAAERLSEQFPDELLVGYDDDGEAVYEELGANAQSNYKLQGVEVI